MIMGIHIETHNVWQKLSTSSIREPPYPPISILSGIGRERVKINSQGKKHVE